MSSFALNRFLQAQEFVYENALREIKSGRKHTHWIWFIFPQLQGLGTSEMACLYGINGLEEAREYLAHPILSDRLTQICEALLTHKGENACDILGDIDAMKVRSSMTLFALISEEGSVFHQVLDCFYGSQPDMLTLKLAKE